MAKACNELNSFLCKLSSLFKWSSTSSSRSFCGSSFPTKPIINSESDRQAIVSVATSGNPSFFLGTDSAPHPTSEKYGEQAKAGIFNAAYGLEVGAEIFAKENKLEHFADFASKNGAAFYGYQPSEDELLLTRKQVEVELASTLSTRDGDQVVLFGVDEASQWTVSPV